MITGMHHSGVIVLDLQKAVEFYTGAVGLRLKGTFEFGDDSTAQILGYKGARVKSAELVSPDGEMIELLEYVTPEAPRRSSEERSLQGASHLAFKVDDIEQAYESLISKGGKELNPPVQESPGVKVCYLQDPEGNWIELVEEK